MERIVQLIEAECVYTFRVDHDLPLSFWRVEIPGRMPYLAPLHVTGDEQPGFFRALARVAESEPFSGRTTKARRDS